MMLFTSEDDRVRLEAHRTAAGAEYLTMTVKVGASLHHHELSLEDAMELAAAITRYAAKRVSSPGQRT